MAKKSDKKKAGKPKKVTAELVDDTQEKAAPKTVNTWWIVLAVGIIMLAGFVLIRVGTGTPEYTQNGFRFEQVRCTQERDCWQTIVNTNIGAREVIFFYGPREVEDVLVQPAAVQNVINMTFSRDTEVIIAFDEGVPGEVGVAATNLARITGERIYNISTRGAVYGSQVTCAAATPKRSVIYITQTETNGVVYRDGCVIVGATDTENLLRVTDAFGLHLLRILP